MNYDTANHRIVDFIIKCTLDTDDWSERPTKTGSTYKHYESNGISINIYETSASINAHKNPGRINFSFEEYPELGDAVCKLDSTHKEVAKRKTYRDVIETIDNFEKNINICSAHY